jgi:hypothetical protein
MTLRKHHKSQEEKGRSSQGEDDDDIIELPNRRPHLRRKRSGSEPSSDRPPTHRRRRRLRDGSPQSDDDQIEILPDRFDAQGRPLDPGERKRRNWASRRGDFEYRSTERAGPHVEGAWQVGGTNPELVERMAQGVGNILEGRSGWMGLLGNLLTNLPAAGGDQGRRTIDDEGYDEDDEAESRGRRRRRRTRRWE